MTLGIRLTRWLFANAFLAGIAFICAGTVSLPIMWAYLAFFAGIGLVTLLVSSPDLAAERSQPAAGGIDPGIRPLASALLVTTVAIGALDVGRLHHSTVIHQGVRLTALGVLVVGGGLQIWAMAANPFFSTALRVQSERGHRLVTHGPYRFIRHPGYLAMLLFVPGSAVALGSTLALIPASIYGAVILFRVSREDRFLIYNLAGYTDYICSVRYRLVPGLW